MKPRCTSPAFGRPRACDAWVLLGLVLMLAAWPLRAAEVPSICIAEFTGADGAREWAGVAAGMRDLLICSLTQTSRVVVLEREALDDVLAEQSLTLQGITSAGGAAVGRMLGADKVVTGSVLAGGDELTLLAQVLDVRTAVVQASVRAQGRPADVLDIAMELGAKLAAALELPFDPGALHALDTTPFASLHYFRGLGFFHAGNHEQAIASFLTCSDMQGGKRDLTYWTGRAYLGLDEPEHARVDFERYLDTQPGGPRTSEVRALLEDCRARIAALPPRLRLEGEGP